MPPKQWPRTWARIQGCSGSHIHVKPHPLAVSLASLIRGQSHLRPGVSQPVLSSAGFTSHLAPPLSGCPLLPVIPGGRLASSLLHVPPGFPDVLSGPAHLFFCCSHPPLPLRTTVTTITETLTHQGEEKHRTIKRESCISRVQTKWQQMVAALFSTKGQFIRKTLNWREWGKNRASKEGVSRKRRKRIKVRHAKKKKIEFSWVDVSNPLLFFLIDKGYQKEDPNYIRGIENLRIKLNKPKLRDIMNLDSYEETQCFKCTWDG